MSDNEQYLKLTSIFHYVVGGLAGLCACTPIIHFTIGLTMLLGFWKGEVEPAEEFPLTIVGTIFTAIPGAIILAGWAFALSIIFAGLCLARRQRYMYCLVVAGVECIFMPFGTVLGVLTLILLLRPEVKRLFDTNTSITPSF